MTITQISSPDVPDPLHRLFSNCLRVGDSVFLSGQHAGTEDGGLLGDGTMASQTREAFRKIEALLVAAGGCMADVVKLTFYVTDLSLRKEASLVRKEFFSDPMPCSTLIGVSGLAAPNLLVEIDAVAVLGASRRDGGHE